MLIRRNALLMLPVPIKISWNAGSNQHNSHQRIYERGGAVEVIRYVAVERENDKDKREDDKN